jgi:hypothetical protein
MTTRWKVRSLRMQRISWLLILPRLRGPGLMKIGIFHCPGHLGLLEARGHPAPLVRAERLDRPVRPDRPAPQAAAGLPELVY